ncbi:TGS domain-containing protein, partial [Exiguobacterium aquaticum]
MIQLTFPDGAVKEFEAGITAEEVAGSISPGLRKKAIAAKIDGEMIDYRRPIEHDGNIELVMPDSEDGIDLMRHSSAHLMAQAIKRLYGEEGSIYLGIG